MTFSYFTCWQGGWISWEYSQLWPIFAMSWAEFDNMFISSYILKDFGFSFLAWAILQFVFLCFCSMDWGQNHQTTISYPSYVFCIPKGICHAKSRERSEFSLWSALTTFYSMQSYLNRYPLVLMWHFLMSHGLSKISNLRRLTFYLNLLFLGWAKNLANSGWLQSGSIEYVHKS